MATCILKYGIYHIYKCTQKEYKDLSKDLDGEMDWIGDISITIADKEYKLKAVNIRVNDNEVHSYLTTDSYRLLDSIIGDKVPGKTIKNQKLTLSTNKQTQSIMATEKKIQIGTTKNGSPVYSNAKTASVYRAAGTKHKKPAMVVPVQFVTLPQGFYTHATKYLETGKPYNGKRQFNTYVIGCAFTKNNKKLYVVAQLTYMGGKPAIAVNHYRGYSKRTAWIVFNNLPYHEVKYTQASGQSVSYKSDGTYHAAIQQNIRRRQAFYANRQNGGGNFRSSANGASFSRRR